VRPGQPADDTRPARPAGLPAADASGPPAFGRDPLKVFLLGLTTVRRLA